MRLSSRKHLLMCSVISFSGGWMDIEREDIDQECNWALVSIGSCLGHRRLNYPAPSTDRIQVPSASAIHLFPWHGPTYIRAFPCSKGLCHSNTANNSLPASRTKEFCLHSSSPGKPSSGNKRLRSTGVLMSLVTCAGA